MPTVRVRGQAPAATKPKPKAKQKAKPQPKPTQPKQRKKPRRYENVVKPAKLPSQVTLASRCCCDGDMLPETDEHVTWCVKCGKPISREVPEGLVPAPVVTKADVVRFHDEELVKN